MLSEVTVNRDVLPGSGQEPHFARAFFIDDSEVAWIVEKGYLDLFLVEQDSQGLAGPRRRGPARKRCCRGPTSWLEM